MNQANVIPSNFRFDPTVFRVTALAWQAPRRSARGSAVR